MEYIMSNTFTGMYFLVAATTGLIRMAFSRKREQDTEENNSRDISKTEKK